MNPKHVLDFVNTEINRRQIDSDNTLDDYNKAVAAYKALSAFKRFFANNPQTDYWNFGEYWIEELKDIRRKAEYKFKMDYQIMDIPTRWHNRFYKWAADNKIPF